MSSSIYVVVGNVNMSPTLRKIKRYNPMQEKVFIYQKNFFMKKCYFFTQLSYHLIDVAEKILNVI